MDVKDKQLICEICNVSIPSEQQRNSHLTGKKHQLALHQASILEAKEKCGIYIKGFPTTTKPEELIKFLSTYGEIVDSFFAENNSFAMLQFNSPTAVELLVKKKLQFNGKWLVINRRIVRKKEDRGEFLKNTENFEEINKNLKTISSFENQIKALINYLQPNWSAMGYKYEQLCIDLKKGLSEIFPDCVVYPFGSTITGLSFASSDVDIYVQVTSVNGPIPPNNCKASAYVIKSKKWLERYPKYFSHICSIPKAKTPIVRLIHCPTRLSCDFNFKNMLGVCNTYLTKYYLSLDERLISIMIVLKYWAKLHDISGSSGKFSNYSLIMLFIFYLQSEKYSFPSVETLQNSTNCVDMQESWNGGFTGLQQFRNNLLKNFTMPQILHGFFEYYVNFDYTLNVICPYLGRPILKTDFLKPECLPDKFNLYKVNIVEQHPLKVDSPICVQDPFEHNHNLLNSIPARILEEFVRLCRIGMELFKNEPIDNSVLYKLFTDSTDFTLLGKHTHANNKFCNFNLVMDSSCLLHLNNKVNSTNDETTDPDEKVKRIQFAWYDVANTFILEFLTKIMKFSVRLKMNNDSKAQRLNEQNDIHDTDVVEKLSYCCTGSLNLWETRKSILKDLHIGASLGFLQKQINVSEYMYNLYKKQNVTDTIIEFEFNAAAKINPVQLSCEVVKVNAQGHHFVSFVAFLVRTLPSWFIKYCKELDQNLNK